LPVEYDQVVHVLPPNEDGASLLQVSQACQSLGISVASYRLSESQAVKSPSAFLAFLPPRNWEESNGVGHFLVVTGYDASIDRFITIDGVDGRVFKYDRKQFFLRWSGIVLMRRADSFSISTAIFLVVPLACILVMAIQNERRSTLK
jgi:ABC-type bacteriocin/lantibiotic exporter with double-glycine peptidase domain